MARSFLMQATRTTIVFLPCYSKPLAKALMTGLLRRAAEWHCFACTLSSATLPTKRQEFRWLAPSQPITLRQIIAFPAFT